jgi:hypothetical protein
MNFKPRKLSVRQSRSSYNEQRVLQQKICKGRKLASFGNVKTEGLILKPSIVWGGKGPTYYLKAMI